MNKQCVKKRSIGMGLWVLIFGVGQGEQCQGGKSVSEEEIKQEGKKVNCRKTLKLTNDIDKNAMIIKNNQKKIKKREKKEANKEEKKEAKKETMEGVENGKQIEDAKAYERLKALASKVAEDINKKGVRKEWDVMLEERGPEKLQETKEWVSKYPQEAEQIVLETWNENTNIVDVLHTLQKITQKQEKDASLEDNSSLEEWDGQFLKTKSSYAVEDEFDAF